MAFIDHIRACNACDLSRFRRFRVAGHPVGWVRHELARRLVDWPELFVTGESELSLADDLADYAARTRAMDQFTRAVAAAGLLPRLRGEAYPVLTEWGAEPLLALDRAVVPWFGIEAYGLHVNGYVRTPDGGLHMWVARRAADRLVAPGKLDNLVAGGQPVGLSLAENLVKEAYEEAGIGPGLAGRAKPVGAIRYRLETEAGVKPDTLFLFDLELEPGFRPRNTDGEVEAFVLMPVAEVAAIVRDSDAFKFNCNLVVIDFLIRHGVIGPDEPDYLHLVSGLRRH
jgi:8-oxo-dGTP pyrophosphatase MutT (NUDIX family)